MARIAPSANMGPARAAPSPRMPLTRVDELMAGEDLRGEGAAPTNTNGMQASLLAMTGFGLEPDLKGETR